MRVKLLKNQIERYEMKLLKNQIERYESETTKKLDREI